MDDEVLSRLTAVATGRFAGDPQDERAAVREWAAAHAADLADLERQRARPEPDQPESE